MPLFQLKGGLYPLTALQLLGTQLEHFQEQLSAKINQAPQFFYHAPVVIDLHKLGSSEDLDFHMLKHILMAHHLIPIGVKGATSEQHSAAIAAGFAILQDNTSSKTEAPALPTATPEFAPEPAASEPLARSLSKVITEPVRSGQQIYAQGGDLIVLGPVSHGAEVLADGHIHVYGPLRGRALAGINGDTKAHIFCQSLEAELISIAGQYKISEDFEKSAWQVPVNIFLEAEHLRICTF